METPTHPTSIFQRLRLDGKVALVTGASKGIGEAIARALAQAGATVVISSRKQHALDEVKQQLLQEGLAVEAIAANVGRLEDNEQLVAATVAKLGRLDIVVNNAATNPYFGPIQDMQMSYFDKTLDVNLRGPLALSQLAYPHLKAQGGGSIINISSIEGFTPSAGMGIYSISKAALLMLTKVLAREWGQDGIRINAICPGLVETKFSEMIWKNQAVMEKFMKAVPLGRAGKPEEVAAMALYLASELGAYCTGAAFTVDGGTIL